MGSLLFTRVLRILRNLQVTCDLAIPSEGCSSATREINAEAHCLVQVRQLVVVAGGNVLEH